MNLYIVWFYLVINSQELTWRSWKSTSPCNGQEWSGWVSSITRAGSLGIQVYWNILSTDIILFSIWQRNHITLLCNMFRVSPYVTDKPAMPSGKRKAKKKKQLETIVWVTLCFTESFSCCSFYWVKRECNSAAHVTAKLCLEFCQSFCYDKYNLLVK